MSHIIGIVGMKNGELELSIPVVGQNEPSELCVNFTYELDDDTKPYSHSDMDNMYDGFDFKNNQALLQKGYSKENAIGFLSKIISTYESLGKIGLRDLKAAIEMKEIINSDDFIEIDTIYFIEIRY